MASKANLRKLKLPNKLTTRQIWMLKNEAGYNIISENEKHMEFSRPADFVRVRRKPELSEPAKEQIRRRLNNVIEHYVEPEFFKTEIMTRIRNITRTFTALESDYVWEWIEQNL